LLGEGPDDRKQWVEDRLKALAEIFAIAVGGFSVMDNHLQLLVRLDQDVARSWSDEEVVRRWGRLFPPRDKSGGALPVPEAWVKWRLEDAKWMATIRGRLQSISWFMKCLKEPLSRLVGQEVAPRVGGLGWRGCARVACLAYSLRRVEKGCARRSRG
jgi:hypothetical protein